jgi:hypothetical protein
MARAYEGLTMPQRIALAFHHLADDNELEVLRLRDTIPRQSFGSPMRTLEHGIERWRAIAAYFGVMHWRLRSLCNEARFAAHVAMNPDLPKVPPDAPYDLLMRAAAIEAQIMALDRALDMVCAEHGLDPADIRKVNAITHHRPLMPSCLPDTAFVNEQLEILREAIDGW